MKMAWKCNSDKDTKKLVCSCYASENMHKLLKEGDNYSTQKCKQQAITVMQLSASPCKESTEIRYLVNLDFTNNFLYKSAG